MFAVYATHAAPDDPLAALKIGEQPEPNVPEGWVRVKVSHASLNRHDLFTLRGMSGHPEGITYPIILGNDAAGTLDDGTPVVIYPMMGSDDWRGDETLAQGPFAPPRICPRHGLADCIPCALYQVGTSGWRDRADPGCDRRYGDCSYPARSCSRL